MNPDQAASTIARMARKKKRMRDAAAALRAANEDASVSIGQAGLAAMV